MLSLAAATLIGAGISAAAGVAGAGIKAAGEKNAAKQANMGASLQHSQTQDMGSNVGTPGEQSIVQGQQPSYEYTDKEKKADDLLKKEDEKEEDNTQVLDSDENLKDAYDNDGSIKNMAEINSYDFKYTPEAQQALGLDGDTHTGVMAQEVGANPSFKGCVSQRPDIGTLRLNIPELTAANTAGLGELARALENFNTRLTNLENEIGDR